mgnify:FL=1
MCVCVCVCVLVCLSHDSSIAATMEASVSQPPVRQRRANRHKKHVWRKILALVLAGMGFGFLVGLLVVMQIGSFYDKAGSILSLCCWLALGSGMIVGIIACFLVVWAMCSRGHRRSKRSKYGRILYIVAACIFGVISASYLILEGTVLEWEASSTVCAWLGTICFVFAGYLAVDPHDSDQMRREKMKKQLYLSKMKRREQRRQKHTAKDNVLSLSINHSLEERHDRHRQQYSPTVSCEEEDEDDSDLDGQEGLLGEIPLSAGVARSGYGTRTHSAFLVPTIRQVGVSPGRVTGSWIASHQQPQIPYSEEEEEDEEERVENEEGDLEDEEAAQDHPRRGRGEGSIGRTPEPRLSHEAEEQLSEIQKLEAQRQRHLRLALQNEQEIERRIQENLSQRGSRTSSPISVVTSSPKASPRKETVSLPLHEGPSLSPATTSRSPRQAAPPSPTPAADAAETGPGDDSSQQP